MIFANPIETLSKKLERAYLDEWLAFYQYFVEAKVIESIVPRAIKELKEHAIDEFKHANMVFDRAKEIGHTVLFEPKYWQSFSNCGYTSPSNPKAEIIINQAIEGERCAIKVYTDIAEYAKEIGDTKTYDIAKYILDEEIEHENDLNEVLLELKGFKDGDQ